MSLSYLRDNIVKALQEKADKATTNAVNMRVRPGGDMTPAMTTDEYALRQVDALSEARALLVAINTVTAEYAKMIEPEKVVEITAEPAKKKGSVYG